MVRAKPARNDKDWKCFNNIPMISTFFFFLLFFSFLFCMFLHHIQALSTISICFVFLKDFVFFSQKHPERSSTTKKQYSYQPIQQKKQPKSHFLSTDLLHRSSAALDKTEKYVITCVTRDLFSVFHFAGLFGHPIFYFGLAE